MRNIEKAAAKIEDASLLTSQWDEIINDPEIEIVIELMGGINPAKEYILSALKAGKHVVSANKDFLYLNFTANLGRHFLFLILQYLIYTCSYCSKS